MRVEIKLALIWFERSWQLGPSVAGSAPNPRFQTQSTFVTHCPSDSRKALRVRGKAHRWGLGAVRSKRQYSRKMTSFFIYIYIYIYTHMYVCMYVCMYANIRGKYVCSMYDIQTCFHATGMALGMSCGVPCVTKCYKLTPYDR